MIYVHITSGPCEYLTMKIILRVVNTLANNCVKKVKNRRRIVFAIQGQKLRSNRFFIRLCSYKKYEKLWNHL